MKSLKHIMPWLLVLVVATSCVQQELGIDLGVVERQMAFPPEKYEHVVYLDNKVIGFIDDDIQISGKDQPGFAYEGDLKMTPFNPCKILSAS